MTDGYAPRANVRIRAQDEPTTPEQSARNSKRLCRARVSLPARDGRSGLLSFECTQLTHPADQDHMESGRVKLRNNRMYEYNFYWSELEPEIWREETHGSSNAD